MLGQEKKASFHVYLSACEMFLLQPGLLMLLRMSSTLPKEKKYKMFKKDWNDLFSLTMEEQLSQYENYLILSHCNL